MAPTTSPMPTGNADDDGQLTAAEEHQREENGDADSVNQEKQLSGHLSNDESAGDPANKLTCQGKLKNPWCCKMI